MSGVRTCWECGAQGPLHDHHVVPRSRGGVRTVPLCEPCHGKAHGRRMSTAALTADALAVKRARGERVGGVPVGYRVSADGVTLERDPAEFRIVAAVLQARRAGMTLRAISDELTAAGYTTRKGGKISHTQVRRILKQHDA